MSSHVLQLRSGGREVSGSNPEGAYYCSAFFLLLWSEAAVLSEATWAEDTSPPELELELDLQQWLRELTDNV